MNKKLILRKPDHRPHTSILKEKHTENREIESERKKQEYAKQKKVSKLFFLKKKCMAYIGHRFFKIFLIHHSRTIENRRK